MALTAKAKRRLALLLILVLAIGGGVAWLHHYQQQRRAELAERHRAEGLAAFEREDYREALEKLGRYHSDAGADGQTLHAYARARLELPTDDGRYLAEGMQALQRAVARPDAPEGATHELLELYQQVGNNNNALDLAEELIADDEGDVRAWRAKAVALTRLNEHPDALAAAERALELEPGHWQMQMLTFQLRNALGESAETLVDKAHELLELNANDPRYELLVGYTYSLLRDREETVRWLRAAAAHEPAPAGLDETFLQTLVRFLDGASLYRESREVLAVHVDEDAPLRLQREAALRLFEGGEIERLVERLAHVDPTGSRLRSAELELAGLRALGLYRLGEEERAAALVSELAELENQPMAEAWASVLRAVHGGEGEAGGPVLEATEAALATYPENPVFRALRASAYEEVGEIELALADWERAAERRPSWSVPRTRQARLLLRRNEPAAATAHAEAGLMRRPGSVEAAIVLAEARAATLDPARANAREVQDLLTLLERIGEEAAGERVLPLHVSVLARLGRVDEARELVREALDRERPLARATLTGLAQLDRQHELALGEAIERRLDEAGPVAGPEALLEQATALAREGEPTEGLALFERRLDELAAAEGEGDRRPWLQARAQYLSYVDDPGAAAAWIELADEHPQDPTVQRRALRSGAGAAEPAFADRALGRLREMLGNASLIWRIERARWLLSAPESHRDSAEAAALLESVVSRAPDRMEPRLLLAEAHEQRGLRPLAVRELTAAAERRPASAAIALQLAELQQAMHHYRRAREQLVRVMGNERASLSERRQAAVLLARQGEDGLALEVLESLRAQMSEGDGPGLDGDSLLLLARLYQRTGQPERAARTVERLLESPSAAAIGFAADFYLARGEEARARAVLGRLEEVDEPAGRAPLIAAERLARLGETEAAVARYREAVEADPEASEAWHQWIAMHLGRGAIDSALDVAAAADRGMGEPDAVVEALLGQRRVLASVEAGHRLPRLLAGLIQAGGGAPEAIAEAVRVLGEGHAQGLSLAALAERFESLADEHSEVAVVQNLAARLYLAADRPEAAARIALRAMSAFPRATEPAWLAAEALSATGQWRQARRAAEQWRGRAGSATLAADMMIAQADLELGQPADALAALEPYLDQARAAPDEHAPMLARYARGLIAAGRVDEAASLLEPMLDRSAEWRERWMRLAAVAVPRRSTAERWLEEAAARIDEGDAAERVRLAQHWARLAERLGAPELGAQARAILEELIEADASNASLWLQHGIVTEQAGELEEAASSYRRALARDPELHVAHNNLAMVLIEQETAAAAEAIEHAERAVAAAPENPYFLDTLAHAQAAAGECQAAIETMQNVVRLAPEEERWRQNLAQILEDCGQEERLTELLDQLGAAGG